MIKKIYNVSARSSLSMNSALGGLALVLGAGLGLPAEGATPTPYLQDSTIVGSGGTLTITDVPVQTSTAGSLVYKDVTIQLNAATNGNLSIAPGYPKQTAAIAPILNNFVAGKYAGPPTLNSKFLVTVIGPGLGAGGATAWSLTASSGAGCGTYPGTATWFTGPIASNPLAARLKKAGISSSFYSYGLIGVGPACGSNSAYGFFEPGDLIGISQIEGSLTIVSFSTGSGTDSPIPLAEITYTLLP